MEKKFYVIIGVVVIGGFIFFKVKSSRTSDTGKVTGTGGGLSTPAMIFSSGMSPQNMQDYDTKPYFTDIIAPEPVKTLTLNDILGAATIGEFGFDQNTPPSESSPAVVYDELIVTEKSTAWNSGSGATAKDNVITGKTGNKYTAEVAVTWLTNQKDPMAIYEKAKEEGLSGKSIDALMGLAPGTSDAWVSDQKLDKL